MVPLQTPPAAAPPVQISRPLGRRSGRRTPSHAPESTRLVLARLRGLALLAVLCVGCDRTPEPAAAPSTASGAASGVTTGGNAPPHDASPDADGPRCVVPSPSEPPPPASSVEICPADPDGRPVMPRGSLRFPEAPGAPALDVELARNDADRAHGLMFRPTLTDEEGMLFSWPYEGRRSFWMKNTCLALDMLFLDAKGYVVGILEQVPPMNEAPRSVHCAAAHVLEVRAGWTRDHGVFAGQRVDIDAALPHNSVSP